jgi:hypothetical protein
VRFVQLDQPLAHSVLNQINTAVQIKLSPDVRAMSLDCVDADA